MNRNSGRNDDLDVNDFDGGNPGFNQGFDDPNFFEDEMDGDYNNGPNWQNDGRPPPANNFPNANWGPFNAGPGNWGPSPPPAFTWGRGFGPAGPPMQRQKRDNGPRSYLQRCGVDRDQVRNLPNAFLRLISPDYCGVCDERLHSFKLSREHYTSKAHFKNQNRWMGGQRNVGNPQKHKKEQPPLKSRDLYCELCDVQITSKVHADSHYSGKPHRAILDGRKKPKNPALLHKNMQGRVEQLIRREKRFVKSAPVVEKPPEEPVAKAAVQAELYCNICDTSVTCSEQMTMHLNGKRHLSKEKQHILKMMKGDVKNEDKGKEGSVEGPEAEVAEAGKKGVAGRRHIRRPGEARPDRSEAGNPIFPAEEAAVAEDQQEAEGDDKYDWGNGSEAWEEEQPKKQ